MFYLGHLSPQELKNNQRNTSMHRLLFSLSGFPGWADLQNTPSIFAVPFIPLPILHHIRSWLLSLAVHLVHFCFSAWQFRTLHSPLLSSLNARTSPGMLYSLLSLLSSSLSSLPFCTFLCSHHILPYLTYDKANNRESLALFSKLIFKVKILVTKQSLKWWN